MNIIQAQSPKKNELRTIRTLIWIGCFLMVLFIGWFINPYHIGNSTLFWILTVALGFRLLRMLHEWYHYYKICVPEKPKLKHKWTVDVFTTACPGEPHNMVIRTLEAIQAMKYPHKAYLCDEGNDPVYIEACKRLGVIHITRTEKTDAKAGNINNALKQSSGDICLILDPDHVPHPDFLDRVIPFFEDPDIGYVQVVQAYSNRKESIVAYGAAEQTYHFYGPMMMCMHSYGTAQAIGANCTFRRKALESIGGHAAGLAEDMHTAMRLHAEGWKSVYVPEVLSKGLVPATMASYFKQQLKWARGTFELLFTTYFPLFRKFTWQQKIHYFALPLYYLFGLINFIDILIPILSLILAVFPWNVDLVEFLIFYTPLLFTSLAIRQYAQRWLLEEHEKGFHVIGGILRTGTWWIYLLGLIYTIIRKKIPYIPTPKDDKPQNNLLLSLPNILACLASIAAILYSRHTYGHKIFMHPYNLLMVGFALTNITILGTMVITGQERFIASAIRFIRQQMATFQFLQILKRQLLSLHYNFLKLFRTTSVFLCFTVLFISGCILTVRKMTTYEVQAQKPIDVRKKEPFFTGIYLPDITNRKSPTEVIKQYEEAMGTSFSIVSIYQSWGPESLDKFPKRFIKNNYRNGALPMITWEPWTNTFPEFASHPELSQNKKVFKSILDGQFDKYLKAYSHQIKELKKPVFIRFAHEPDNPIYPWSASGENSPEEYVKAWQYVVTFFKEQDVLNVIWVWNPWKDLTMQDYYPGSEYVDWIGITGLNYGFAATDGLWHSFAALYEPYRQQIAFSKDADIKKKPVMIAEFGTTSYGGNQTEWLDEALYRIQEIYPEVQSVVFFYSNQDKNWATDWRPTPDTKYLDWTFADSTKTLKVVKEKFEQPPFKNKPTIKSKETTFSSNLQQWLKF